MKKTHIWIMFVFVLAALAFVLRYLPGGNQQLSPGQVHTTAPSTGYRLQSAKGVQIGEISYTAAVVKPDMLLEEAIRHHLKGYDNCDADPAMGVRYFYNTVDLNNDNISETIVYLVGRYTCGSGGCATLVFRSGGNRHELISHITLTSNPILVSHETTNGWRDLVLYVSGGGAMASYRRLGFTGNSYPGNPSVEPAIERDTIISGDAYLANEILFDTQAPVLLSPGCHEKEPAPGLMHTDRLGDLRIDMPERDVIKLLGEPGNRGKRLLWEADALHHQEWRYPQQGIFLDLVSTSADSKQRVASIRVGLHSLLETKAGVKIGDSFDAVSKAYAEQLDADNSDPPFTLLAGSLNDGILFSFEEGKVIQIFLGTAAE